MIKPSVVFLRRLHQTLVEPGWRDPKLEINLRWAFGALAQRNVVPEVGTTYLALIVNTLVGKNDKLSSAYRSSWSEDLDCSWRASFNHKLQGILLLWTLRLVLVW